MDRALLCEQQARDANLRAEKAEEEARALQKKIQTIENELDQTQEQLMQVNAKLEEKDKALQNVSSFPCTLYLFIYFLYHRNICLCVVNELRFIRLFVEVDSLFFFVGTG